MSVWQIELTKYAITAATTAVIAIGSTLLAARLALSRYREEKLWERRVLAYENILEAISQIHEFSETHLNANYEHREVDDQKDKALRDNIQAANSTLYAARTSEAIWLSRNAIECLQNYQRESDQASRAMDWWEYIEGEYDASSKCIADFTQTSKNDLKIPTV